MERHLAEASADPSVESELAAAEQISHVMFDAPIDPIPQQKAIEAASRKAMDNAALQREATHVANVKQQLARHGVDPVSLGIASQAEWDAVSNAKVAEDLAKKAALMVEKQQSKAWETRAAAELRDGPQRRSQSYDPASTREGRVMSTASMQDDIAPHNPSAPLNAISMSDPERLDRLASEDNSHDLSVAESRRIAAEREKASLDWRTAVVPDDLTPMKSATVIPSGGEDAAVGRYKAPANQVSMTDDISAASPDELQDKLAAMFSSRIPDTREQIRESNEERRASIQREEKDRSREGMENQRPTSTRDIQNRLTELWLPQNPE
jgi:hypothetical protein